MCLALCSGISRLTRQAYFSNTQVLAPVYIHYGWALDNGLHLGSLTHVYAYYIPSYSWSAMPCKYWARAGKCRNPPLTLARRTAHSARLLSVVWIARPARQFDVSVILDSPQSSHMWQQSPLAEIAFELQAVAFRHCVYQSKNKGKHPYKPTPLMSTCELQDMQSKYKCIIGHRQLFGTHMTAAGRYPSDMCDPVLDIIVSRQNQEQIHDVNPVEPGPVLFKSE